MNNYLLSLLGLDTLSSSQSSNKSTSNATQQLNQQMQALLAMSTMFGSDPTTAAALAAALTGFPMTSTSSLTKAQNEDVLNLSKKSKLF